MATVGVGYLPQSIFKESGVQPPLSLPYAASSKRASFANLLGVFMIIPCSTPYSVPLRLLPTPSPAL